MFANLQMIFIVVVLAFVLGFVFAFFIVGGHKQTASLDANTQTQLDNISNSQIEIKHLIQNIQNSQQGLINIIRVKNPKAAQELFGNAPVDALPTNAP